jgi:ubiquinone/menaquinone biosynthesis C-methylase UbiE
VSWQKLSLVLFAAAALPAQRHGEHQMTHDAAEYARRLNDPLRDSWQKPHEVVVALEFNAGEVVADIGAGTGYFAKRFARHAGKVLAVDIDSRLLQMAASGAPPNLTTVLGANDDPRLDPASVDTVFFCDVLHHIDNRPAYLAKVRSALKPGGRLVVIDFEKRETPVGPAVQMRIGKAEMVREIEAAGFARTRELDILPYQYFLIFARN